MRPLEHIDVRDAARVLLAAPAGTRAALCLRMLDEADWADAYTSRIGRQHALWGDGTLSAAARKRVRAREPRLNDVEYCTCLETVLRTILKRKEERASR
ncbi:MAG: hypothetical protein AAGM84_03920 [Pseudomonadota bacterium]